VIAAFDGQLPNWVDLSAILGGSFFGVCWLGWLCIKRRDPLATTGVAESHLAPPVPAICMIAYLSGALIMQALGNWILKPGLPAPLGERLVQTAASVVAATTLGVACVVFGASSFRGGLRGFGLRRRGLPRDVAAGIVGLLVAFPVCTGLLYVSEMVVRWWTGANELPQHPVLEVLASPALPLWGRACAIAGPIVLAPVAEELFFRGIVQSFVRQHLGTRWGAVLISSLVFGLAHYVQPHVVVPLTALGFVLGYLYEKRGSLWAPIVLHILFNLRTIVWQVARS
jgi:membrane protease YdiL (CAAX protease family)